MDYTLQKVTIEEKDILFNLLQFALYDGSQYVENELNENGLFKYTWFNNYFTDPDREAYFIKNNDKYLGFAMINSHLQFEKEGKSIAEFLIMPQYRRHHIGKRVAFEIFDKYKGNWEVAPIGDSEQAYNFWKKTIEQYTNNNYEIKDNIFIFKN